MVGCGITTMFHSISMFREGTWDVKAIRQAPQVRLAELVARYRHEERLIRHRYHLRYEIDNLACYEQVKEMIQKGYVDLLSFMDHTPGQGQYKNLDIYRKHQPNEGRDMTERSLYAVKSEFEKETSTFDQLKELWRWQKNAVSLLQAMMMTRWKNFRLINDLVWQSVSFRLLWKSLKLQS